MRTVLIIVACLMVLALLGSIAFGLEWAGLAWQGYFSPKHEDVRREVFKATRSYNEGKLQELVKYRLEYMRTKDDTERGAIAATVRMAFSEYDESKLTPELCDFVRICKYGKQESY